MSSIVQKENAVLREKAREVPTEEITSPRIAKIIQAMKTALNSQTDGVAIAAPQIDECVRIFVVSKKIFDLEEKANPSGHVTGEEMSSYESGEREDLVFINPKITRTSRKKLWMEEGCLSVRWLYGKVERAEKVTVCAHDEKGKVVSRGASGVMAQVFQHEIDHLNGILFTDKAKEVREMRPEEANGKYE